MLLAILLSLGGWYSVQRRSSAIDDAAAAARQLIGVQDVRVAVVQADSLASRAYLAGGQEDPAQRKAYEASSASASDGLVQVALGAAGTDAPLLQAANAGFAGYLGLAEQARANNRQGFPVGAAYQRQAHEISNGVVANLRQVEANARQRVDDSIERAHRSSWLLVLTTFLLLAAIIAGGMWVAIRWRRLINVPLAAAGLLTLIVLTGGVGVNAAAMNDADSVVESSLAAADVLAQARAAAFDARSNEALTLVYRGNGASFAQQWKESQSIVDSALDESCSRYGEGCKAADSFATYASGYAAVRELDDAGDWDDAVDLSLTGVTSAETSAPGVDPVAAFDEFSGQSQSIIGIRSAAAAHGFDEAVGNLGALRLMIVLAGLVIAVLAVFGYGQRLREYR